jgi:hypothetical protein
MGEVHGEYAADQADPAVQAESSDELSIGQIVGSVLASFFGVQSSRNRKRDFKSGKAKQFVVVGIIMTAVCCLTLYSVVSMVMWLAR